MEQAENLPELLGESESLLKAKEHISKAAKINRPILILGERGTGKEIAATRLHYLSGRWQGPYVALNCAALNPNLLESELFGHEKAAFTGAEKKNLGKFAAAHNGTLFLDEISHLTIEAQAKILRAVEYGLIQALGSLNEIKVDVRVIAASNVNLNKMVLENTFLPDLLDRLSFDIIQLPPLRKRENDTIILAHRFYAQMCQELGFKHLKGFSEKALETLKEYNWPGNVRELKNTVERAVYKAEGEFIEKEDLKFFNFYGLNKLEDNIEDFKKITENQFKINQFDYLTAKYAINIMEEVLKKYNYNQKQAAQYLALSYHRFRFLYNKYENIIKEFIKIK